MPLFKILSDRTLEKVDRREFANEEELHRLIEKNLSYVMGIRLIASEYPIPNGRIDTLGLDENKIPVIIEYKWKKDLSAMVQGLFYLDWVMQNKKPFESIVKDKLGKDRVGQSYCDYRTTSTFANIQVQKRKLRIFIKMGDRPIDDPQNLCKPVPPTFGFGLLKTQFEISKKEEIDYSLMLIRQAYDFVSE